MILKNMFLYLIFALKNTTRNTVSDSPYAHRETLASCMDTTSILAIYNKSNIILQITFTIGIIVKLYE